MAVSFAFRLGARAWRWVRPERFPNTIVVPINVKPDANAPLHPREAAGLATSITSRAALPAAMLYALVDSHLRFTVKKSLFSSFFTLSQSS